MAEKQLTLDEIIAEIESAPEKVKDRVDKHNEARESYKLGTKRPAKYKSAINEIARYLKHHSKVVDGVAKPEHHATTEAHGLLIQYGKQVLNDEKAGDKKAIEAALKAIKKGKLSSILDSYKDAERDNEEKTYVTHVITQYVDPLNRKQHIQIAKDYIDKYKQVFGAKKLKELELMKPGELADQAMGLLFAHRQNIQHYQEQIAREKPKE